MIKIFEPALNDSKAITFTLFSIFNNLLKISFVRDLFPVISFNAFEAKWAIIALLAYFRIEKTPRKSVFLKEVTRLLMREPHCYLDVREFWRRKVLLKLEWWPIFDRENTIY